MEKKKEDGSVVWIVEGCECVSETIKKKLGLKVFVTNNEYSHLFYYSQSLEQVFWYFLLCSIIL